MLGSAGKHSNAKIAPGSRAFSWEQCICPWPANVTLGKEVFETQRWKDWATERVRFLNMLTSSTQNKPLHFVCTWAERQYVLHLKNEFFWVRRLFFLKQACIFYYSAKKLIFLVPKIRSLWALCTYFWQWGHCCIFSPTQAVLGCLCSGRERCELCAEGSRSEPVTCPLEHF